MFSAAYKTVLSDFPRYNDIWPAENGRYNYSDRRYIERKMPWGNPSSANSVAISNCRCNESAYNESEQ